MGDISSPLICTTNCLFYANNSKTQIIGIAFSHCNENVMKGGQK